MKKKKKHNSRHSGLQLVTLCISTTLVLVLIGLVILSVFTARNLSNYVKENLTVTLMLSDEMNNMESQRLAKALRFRPYAVNTTYISPEQALKEHTEAMGSDPSEFLGGNPFVGSIEMHLKSDYANTDSLKKIVKELKQNRTITDITYQKDLMDQVNSNLQKVNIVLLVLAVLLTIISFSLINNTIRLGIYARRFTIHTMKLVGASWGFIRAPFLWQAVALGLFAGVLADAALAGCLYGLFSYEPGIDIVITWQVLAITGGTVILVGLILTCFCAYLSVNRFLRMTAGELYEK